MWRNSSSRLGFLGGHLTLVTGFSLLVKYVVERHTFLDFESHDDADDVTPFVPLLSTTSTYICM